MKKIFIYAIILTTIVACNQKKTTENLELTGNISGLKKGTLYIERIVDTNMVVIDSIEIDGDSNFKTNISISSPEMLYINLDRGTTNSVDNNLPFFAEVGKININTDLDYFFSNAVITGSKNHDLYENYKTINSRFIDQLLTLTELKFKAMKAKNVSKIDSIQRKQDQIIKRKYLYAVNFAINNHDFEVSPYIALSEINDVNLKLMDTIQKSMSPKVAKSLYGKKLIAYYNSRKKVE